MYAHLKNRQYYEDRYDGSTVAACRSGEQLVNKTFKAMEKNLPKNERADKLPGWYLEYSKFYFFFVEARAAERAENRDATIAKWMEEDQAKDDKLAAAHIAGATYCRACGKDTRVVSKDYMRRDGHKDDDIFIMFECDNCNKRMALWQDGTEWEGAKHVCKECGGSTVSKHAKENNVIIWTETCEKCGHVETDSIGLSDTKESEPVDPFLELDRKRFVFDSSMMDKFKQKLSHFERAAKLSASVEDKVQHADVYDGIKQVKKLKIAQLKELLEPIFAKDGYSDFKLGDPQIGREFTLDFSCLDTKDDREEYQSKKTLHKAIEKALVETNWRLMSAGIKYRLGYLTGSLRAYETEEDIKKLVEQRMKNGYVPEPTAKDQTPPPQTKPKGELSGAHMRESAQVYFDKLMLGSVPAEVTLKSGKIKQTTIPVLYGDIHPKLRVFIPMRDNDELVPEFVRNYDFKFGGDDKVPKTSKDSQGRPVRRV